MKRLLYAAKTSRPANRAVSAVSTVGVGGSIAFIVCHYLRVEAEVVPHLTSVIIFAVNTALWKWGYVFDDNPRVE